MPAKSLGSKSLHCTIACAKIGFNVGQPSVIPGRTAGAPKPSFRSSLDTEGARNAGRIVRPQPRAQLEEAHEQSHHGRRTFVRRSARSGLPACFALSPVAIDTLGFVTVGTETFLRRSLWAGSIP